MRCYCYKDVWRSVCTRGRPTLFHLSNTPDPVVPDAPQGPVNRRTLSIHLGLPVGLLLCFADISNLIAEAPTLAPQVVKQRGMEIKRRIETWVPDAQLAMEAGTDSASYVADLASQEMWRHVSGFHTRGLGERHRRARADRRLLSRYRPPSSTSTPPSFASALSPPLSAPPSPKSSSSPPRSSSPPPILPPSSSTPLAVPSTSSPVRSPSPKPIARCVGMDCWRVDRERRSWRIQEQSKSCGRRRIGRG